MTKTKLIFIGLALALVGFLFAGSASAQDRTMTADPASVSEAGTYDIAIEASGFTISSANLAVCSTGDSSLLTGAAELMQYCGGFGNAVSLDDGSYSTTLEGVEVTDAGVTILLFELTADGESAAVSVNVGMDDMGDDMLADTGVETSVLVIIGAGIALAGLMVFGLSRRLRSL
ncbi:hypothetical protein [Candidatus Poriferisocius sp.]|uniref:hypothetical protein n=1 Tax=Candidatus Poriferisocius sp. TaxID=3101276 RepID=UPI003B0174FB